jgi:hypothetical protein
MPELTLLATVVSIATLYVGCCGCDVDFQSCDVDEGIPNIEFSKIILKNEESKLSGFLIYYI